MNITYFDSDEIKEQTLARTITKLDTYRAATLDVIDQGNLSAAQASLATFADEEALQAVYAVAEHFKKPRPKLVIVIGIGGSSLGVEAIHTALGQQGPQLAVLDAVAPHAMQTLLDQVATLKKPQDVALCIISKSGGTTETLANAEVLLTVLRKRFGKSIEQQVIYIGDPNNNLLTYGKKMKSHVVPMQPNIGGRYSVFTPVGLMPLLLLGHNIEALLDGLASATDDHHEEAVAESAARLYLYLKQGYRHVNFFVFDTRLQNLGFWYRQLAAESLGKERDRQGKPVTIGFVPTISTPVELHSIGQLYFSGFSGVYTDIIHFEDEENDFALGKTPKIAKALKGHTMQEIAAAIYGGVIGAYQERALPYRATTFDEDLVYSLGLFMGMRMLETMYVAELMEVDAFSQPNVELYKQKTRKILGV